MKPPITLRGFIAESNRIEGIHRAVTRGEMVAHEHLLAAPALTVPLLESFVWTIAHAPIRKSVGMNVRVGNHLPPAGGPEIIGELTRLLWEGAPSPALAYETHCRYEALHPFMDGNGRSGRAIWLWQMGGIERAALGFLHHFYYQTLNASALIRRRSSVTEGK